MSLIINGAQFEKFCTNLSKERAASFAALFSSSCIKYGIDNVDIFHEFIANVAHESACFERRSENLNYSAEGLLRTFGSKYFKTIIAARRFERQPEKIANYVYGGRMGNRKPGDGWMFRGGGFAQLTGRSIYQSYCAYLKIKDEYNAANLIRTTDEYAIDSACWFFAKYKSGLIRLAEDDMMGKIVYRWNGGYNGLSDRILLLQKAKEVFI